MFDIEEVRLTGATTTLYVMTKDREPTGDVALSLGDARLLRDILEYEDAAPGQAHTSLGCYPLAAFDKEGDFACSACVQRHELRRDIVSVSPHWEGDPLMCEWCNKQLPSAYGPLED